MTGLDKIIAQIETDTDNICADINARTDKKCEDILSAANNNAENIAQKGKQDAEKRYAEILERAKSSAELESRATLLKTKQECISDALSRALQYLLSLDDKEYFSLILRMVESHSEEKNGEIRFNPRDLARIPDDFKNHLDKCAKGSLTLCENAVDIDGGFIIVYGDIEVNCSFESLFASQSERFSDEVSRILFS